MQMHAINAHMSVARHMCAYVCAHAKFVFVGGCLCVYDFVHVALDGYPFESNVECIQSY